MPYFIKKYREVCLQRVWYSSAVVVVCPCVCLVTTCRLDAVRKMEECVSHGQRQGCEEDVCDIR